VPVYALLLVYTTLLSITTEFLTFFARPVNTGMTIHRIYGSDAEVVPAAYPNLWRVTNCFDSPTFAWMSQAFLNHHNQWTRPQDCLEYRLQLTPDSQTQRRAFDCWDGLTTAMKQITGIPDLVPAENKFWVDLPYFRCDYHPDSERLIVTYQVYLWGYGEFVPGTSFCESSDATQFNPGNQIEIPFVPNTGYINLNIDQKIHHVQTANGVRLSACWQWTRKV